MRPFSTTLICDSETPISLYHKLAVQSPYAFLFESAESHQRVGRYSFIGFDPRKVFTFKEGGAHNPLQILQREFKKISYTPENSLPRFQAGFVGYFAYETARHFEKIRIPTGGTKIPEGIFFLPKKLMVFDHRERTITLIAYSQKKLDEMISRYNQASAKSPPLSLSLQNTQNPTPAADNHFTKKVELAKDYIRAGEAFQIVLSRFFESRTDENPFNLYRRLRLISPSPYMYLLQFPEFSIVGSSPETLVRTEKNEIIVRPIAGTRRRGENFEDDARLEKELLADEKERAEHMMLVDLGRHDAGKVSQPGSVRVSEFMKIEKYSHVMHMVSEIRGLRLHSVDLFDIFKAAFPAGTLTGAPKIRAMEIIASLEKKPRGIYGGAVGYFGFNGEMDFAIAIRTLVCQKGSVSLRAGAGIVYDSSPEMENKECSNKARGPLSALSL